MSVLYPTHENLTVVIILEKNIGKKKPGTGSEEESITQTDQRVRILK